MRNIQTLLLSNRELFNSVNFKYDKYAGCPINNIRNFCDLGYDEINVFSVSRYTNTQPSLKFLERLVRASTVPISYGGGVTSIEFLSNLYDIGFDKVVINSYRQFTPAILEEFSRLRGKQSLAACVNFRSDSKNQVVSLDNDNISLLNTELFDELNYLSRLPFGEVLIQDVSNDGDGRGLSLPVVNSISSNDWPFQTIFSGGADSKSKNLIEFDDRFSVGGGTKGLYFGSLRSVLCQYN